MICSKCGLDMLISHTTYKVTGDDSPDTPTEMFAVQIFGCKNESCTGYMQPVEGESISLMSTTSPKTMLINSPAAELPNKN